MIARVFDCDKEHTHTNLGIQTHIYIRLNDDKCPGRRHEFVRTPKIVSD